jgi:hypothetical protein
VLPDGFQRIRHYGFLVNGQRKAKMAAIRTALAVAPPVADSPDEGEAAPTHAPIAQTCPCCGGAMRIIETLPDPRRRHLPRFDTS